MIDNPFNLQESPSPNSFDFEKRLSSLEALIGIVYTPIGEGHAISSKMSKNIMKHIKHERNNNADTFRLLKIYSENLEERVHQLEQSLKSERKNTKRIDRKLRHRIQMLESRVDIMEFISEKQKDSEVPMKSSPYGNYKNKMVFKKNDLETPKEGAFYSPQKSQDKAIKVAIRVENEEEFNELMIIMDRKSWRWCDKEQFIGTSYFSKCEEGGRVCVYFHDNSSWFYENDKGQKVDIIPFKTLKAILG